MPEIKVYMEISSSAYWFEVERNILTKNLHFLQMLWFPSSSILCAALSIQWGIPGDGEDNVNHIYSPINPPQLLLAVTAWYGRYRCWEMIVSPSVLAAPQSPSVHHHPVTVILTRFCIGDCHSIILCVLWVMSIESFMWPKRVSWVARSFYNYFTTKIYEYDYIYGLFALKGEGK